MLMKNISDKSVSKKLPGGLIVTLVPGESFEFPNLEGYTGDCRLSKVEVVELPVVKEKFSARIKEVVGDLLDDGKRNYSNNPKKKSPGRKKNN